VQSRFGLVERMRGPGGRPMKLGGRGILPGRIQTGQTGVWLLGAANASLVILFLTYLALRPAAPSGLLQESRRAGEVSAMASHLDKLRVSNAALRQHGAAKKSAGSARTGTGAGRVSSDEAEAAIPKIKAAGVKAGAELWKDMQKIAAGKHASQQQQLAGAGKKQLRVQSLACGECAYKDNPLSEIDEPNIFPGPSEFGPDSPTALGPLGNAVNSACCGGSGENAFGAPALSLQDMRKVYEIGEPNFKEWKEFEKENNIFPGIVDWDPDSPKGYNPPFETKELFDGHGGIVGLEDSDGWEVTPESAAYRDYSKYADGSTEGMDRNVYANGYVFPDY
jgi:hypothetical protein